MCNPRDLPTVLDLDGALAREYLMTGKAYCTVELPPYFVFDPLLKSVAHAIDNRPWSDIYERRPIRSLDNVNYRLFSNKDGKYAWRQLELIHPILYVLLVNCITDDNFWETIRQRFAKFRRADDCIRCLSLPVVPKEEERAAAPQVREWWREIEQRSIEYALDYEYLIHTDVVECYPSMYTHSIAWALHGKEESKRNKGTEGLIGNVIDRFIQDMRCGQTNGIPQGSVLMDLIAEMVLGYADLLLGRRLKEELGDYKILRYRDNYRIFTNNLLDGDKITKVLSEVMIGLGMRLHPQKTEASDQVICSSIKPDKLSWNSRKQWEENPQEHLLIIHDHSMIHPHSGSLVKVLAKFRDRLVEDEKDYQGLPLISIAVDIAYRNPRTYPQVSSIISKCLEYPDTIDRKKNILERIRNKFSKVANAGSMELWLQRICLPDDPVDFDEPLCKLVSGTEKEIWNSSWVKAEAEAVKDAVAVDSIVDQDIIQEIPSIIGREEIELFPLGYY